MTTTVLGRGESLASTSANEITRSDDDDISRPRKKQRKQRPTYSCDECRRLKMKCDRQVPCSNCVRRHRVEACNGGTSNTELSRQDSHTELRQSRDADNTDNLPSEDQYQELHSMEEARRQPQISSSRQSDTQTLELQQIPDKSIGPSSTCHQNTDERQNVLARGHDPEKLHNPPTVNSSSNNMNNISTFASNYSHEALPSAEDGEQAGSYGTLMIGQGGRSRYLGPTANSEWLKDSETQDVAESPLDTRAHTPELPAQSHASQSGQLLPGAAPVAFPFNASFARISTRDLLSPLPPREEVWSLVESYYRYCAWHHDVAPQAQFEKTFRRVYAFVEDKSRSSRVDPQEIALVYIIMAQGTMFNIEMPYYDPSVEDWLHLSERALVKGEFLSNNTLAGLQTLHLMAHLHLHLDKGRRGDIAWPLWGLVMRLAQAMGMHRDGTRWNLPQDVVEERRKAFWEVNAADAFMAHCFSRPCAISPEHCDTEFPSQPLSLSGEKSYFTLRFELSQISAEILNMAMRVRKPPYADVLELNLRLCEFERNVPFSLRSRGAYLSMPSRFPQVADAIEASPEPSRRSMIKSFQQMNLAFNISETIINLHRPYYARALYDEVDDRLGSVYAPSFLTVIERCAIIINIVTDIHVRYTAVSNRQWNLWFHVFGCALCLGTLLLRDPSNPMSSYVLTQIDAAIDLFTSMIQHGAGTPRYRRNLDWLIKFRVRASQKVSAAITEANPSNERQADRERPALSEETEDTEDMELLGWRTRLIERAGQTRQTIRTIHHPATPTGSQVTRNSYSPQAQMDFREHHGQLRTIQGTSSSVPVQATNPDTTDGLLHNFWDPMLLQDIFEHDASASFMNNGPAWWEGSTAPMDVPQPRM